MYKIFTVSFKSFGGILLWVVDLFQLMFINLLLISVRLISLKEHPDCVMISIMFITIG